MAAYYNEFDPYAAAWLRNLISEGLIAPGDVDERSITDVRPDDLRGYTQAHFFAGIGGWSLALRMAGWPDGRPVWTGSCPCQPFSNAGSRKGRSDVRHLWPVWLHLIRECKPPTLFGEQVASAVPHGWLDDVYKGLEDERYAVGAAVLPACGVGAPHRRDRLWFVADAVRTQRRPPAKERDERDGKNARWAEAAGGHGVPRQEFWRDAEWVQYGDGKRRPTKPGLPLLADGIPARVGKLRGFGNAIVPQVGSAFIEAFLAQEHDRWRLRLMLDLPREGVFA